MANVLCSLSLINKIMVSPDTAFSIVFIAYLLYSHFKLYLTYTHGVHVLRSFVHQSTKGKVSKGGEVNTPDSHHSNSNNTSNHHSRDNSSSTVKEMFKNGRAAAEAAGGNSAGNGKSDSKVLEWGSFPPTVIREYYLSKMH